MAAESELPARASTAGPGVHCRVRGSGRREDQPDHFLDPLVRIEAKTDLAMPDVADRHADAQLATARLGAGGIEHARPQHTELELADAALHAEQQSIVRPAGVIDP